MSHDRLANLSLVISLIWIFAGMALTNWLFPTPDML